MNILIKTKKYQRNYDICDLVYAIKSENIEKVKEILALNNFDNKDVVFLLYLAAKSNKPEILQLLLDSNCKIDINAKNFDHRTALHLAVINNKVENVDLLLKYNKNIKDNNDNKESVLSVDRDVKDKYGKIAEDYAKSDDIKNLFNLNHDKNFKSNKNWTNKIEEKEKIKRDRSGSL